MNYQTTSGPRPHRYQSATAHLIPSPSSSLKKTPKDKGTKEAAGSLHRSEGRGFNCVPNTTTLIYTRGTEGSSASIAILNAAACDRQCVCVGVGVHRKTVDSNKPWKGRTYSDHIQKRTRERDAARSGKREQDKHSSNGQVH